MAEALRDDAIYLFVRSFVSLFVRLLTETRTQNAVFSKKTKQFKAMVSIDVVTNRKSYVSFSTDSFLDPYDDLERQQTSLRAQQRTAAKNFTPA